MTDELKNIDTGENANEEIISEAEEKLEDVDNEAYETEDIDEETEDKASNEEGLSKEERAIIKHKKENKILRQRIEELEKNDLNNRFQNEEFRRVKELVDSGVDEDTANARAKAETENKRERYELNVLKINGLENKCPGISIYRNELIEMKNKYPEFSYEDLYNLKYRKDNTYDIKTKAEANAIKNRQEAESKSLKSAVEDKKTDFRLSDDDEKAYSIWLKRHPYGTRKEFVDALYR